MLFVKSLPTIVANNYNRVKNTYCPPYASSFSFSPKPLLNSGQLWPRFGGRKSRKEKLEAYGQYEFKLYVS